MAEKEILTLIYDLDKTLCTKKNSGETYLDVKPIQPMIDQLNKFYDMGYNIIIQTARNMVTQNNDEGKVIKNIGEDTLKWLRIHEVKYHSILFAKPYGHIYIDDKSCINDVSEIERRVGAWNNSTEEQYLNTQKIILNKTGEVQAKIKEIERIVTEKCSKGILNGY